MKEFIFATSFCALLVACDQTVPPAELPDASPAAGEEKAVPAVSAKAEDTQGTFAVEAKSDRGTMFENKSSSEQMFSFKAKGLWSFAAGDLGPTGVGSPAGDSFPLPGANSFALVVKRGDGTHSLVGDGIEVVLKPDEVIYFLMNELTGSYSDNRGALKVDWVKK